MQPTWSNIQQNFFRQPYQLQRQEAAKVQKRERDAGSADEGSTEKKQKLEEETVDADADWVFAQFN